MAYEILKFDKEFKHSNNAHFTDFYHCCLKMYCLLQSCSKADNNEVFYCYNILHLGDSFVVSSKVSSVVT